MEIMTTTTGGALDISLPPPLPADDQPTRAGSAGVSSSLPSPHAAGLAPPAGGHGERIGGSACILDSYIPTISPPISSSPSLDITSSISTQRESRKRSRAKHYLFSGARYQMRLCHLTLGLARGSEADLRWATEKLIRYIRRTTGKKPEYHATWVREADRIHAHLIINMPYIPQPLLLEQFQKYLGEQASLHITLLKHKGKTLEKKLHYALQYAAYQKALINYSHSKDWLPPGLHREWKMMKNQMTRQVPGWRISPDFALR